MQWSFSRRTDLENFMWENGISQEEFEEEMNKHLTSYVCPPGNHPQELLDRVLEIQINFMFHELRNTWERFLCRALLQFGSAAGSRHDRK
jgi:hypothetical protein